MFLVHLIFHNYGPEGDMYVGDMYVCVGGYMYVWVWVGMCGWGIIVGVFAFMYIGVYVYRMY